MKLLISVELAYTLEEIVDFVFQIHVAKKPVQTVLSEALSISGNPPSTLFETAIERNRVLRTQLPAGQTQVTYQAEVETNPAQFQPADVAEFDFADLPSEVLPFLLPSRYCPSDLFAELAQQQFASEPRGFVRAQAISDWVHGALAYEIGSTGPHSTAIDAYQKGRGVCRDFAHLAISICRAAGIPARYTSVYADALSPPDFHAVVEVYLRGPNGGAWFILDPTHMCSADAVARIAVGRDAGDIAFAWTLGNSDSTSPQVQVTAPDRHDTSRTSLAVVGA